MPSEAAMVNTVNGFKAKIDPLIRQVGGHLMSQRRHTALILKQPPKVHGKDSFHDPLDISLLL